MLNINVSNLFNDKGEKFFSLLFVLLYEEPVIQKLIVDKPVNL